MEGLSVEQNLNKAKTLVRKGKALEALDLYNSIIRKFPHNKRAQLGIQQLKTLNIKKLDPPNQKIDTLLEYYKTGQYVEAEKLARLITEDFPEHPFGWKVLGAILKETGRVSESIVPFQKSLEITPQDPIAHSNLGITLQALGRLEEAEIILRKAIALNFDYATAHNNLGITLQGLGRLEEAETSLKQAISLKSDFVEAYVNLGNTLKELNKLDESLSCLNKAIFLKPDFAEAYSNLGNTLKKIGRLEEAEASYIKSILIKPDYVEGLNNLGVILKDLGRLNESEIKLKHVIKLNPNNAEAYNNLGNTLQEMGKLEEAMESYEQANKIRPSFLDAKENMIGCLTLFTPKNLISNPIFETNHEIRKINTNFNPKGIITDTRVVRLISRSFNLIKKYNLNFETELSQIYRRNAVHLNCKRHMSIFDQYNIIPKFCFGCYKVQIEPNNIIDLIKLMMIFDQIKLKDNNTRKCMVELRPEIPGFYKGLIYCSNLKQANEIAGVIDIIVKENISSNLTSKVKRGCSEYPITFPDYKEINNNGPQLMNYNKDWMAIEEIYDKENHTLKDKKINQSISGLNLQDVLIMRNWIDYAKGIGDTSINLLESYDFINHFIYDLARTRNH